MFRHVNNLISSAVATNQLSAPGLSLGVTASETVLDEGGEGRSSRHGNSDTRRENKPKLP